MSERTSDWRPLSEVAPPWVLHDAVIIGQATGPGSTRTRWASYDCYLDGKLLAARASLLQAKTYLSGKAGVELTWHTQRIDPMEVTHYYFGPTKEFGVSVFYWADRKG